MSVVLQAIHDYGKGHDASTPVVTSSLPPEPEEGYASHIRVLLLQEDFAQLEKIAQEHRREKPLEVGGAWKITTFYAGTASPAHSETLKDSDFLELIEILNRWIAKYPDSTTARISLAYAYLGFADLGRGPGFADEVTAGHWELYRSRTQKAKAQLLIASHLKDKDPTWYEAMQEVAQKEGWDNASARELLKEAVAFQPGYYHYYRRYALYLRPQWYGQPGDIQKFAEEVTNPLPEPESSILYFRIATTLACYCKQAVEDIKGISYAKAQRGYLEINRLYGTSELNANRFLFMAFMQKDKAAAQSTLQFVKRFDSSIWNTEDAYNYARAWAEGP